MGYENTSFAYFLQQALSTLEFHNKQDFDLKLEFIFLRRSHGSVLIIIIMIMKNLKLPKIFT